MTSPRAHHLRPRVIACAAALLVAMSLSAALAGSVSAHDRGTARVAGAVHRCADVHVRRRAAKRVRTNLRCPRARGMLRRWLHQRSLPHNEFRGWYCAGKRNVTCGGGNGGSAPFIRFVYRR